MPYRRGELFREEQKKLRKRKKAAKSTLSFAMDDDGDGADDLGRLLPTLTMEMETSLPNVQVPQESQRDTSFLPDRDREEAERREREHSARNG